MSFFNRKPPSDTLAGRFGAQDESLRAIATGDIAAMARLIAQSQKSPQGQPVRR